MKAATLNEIRQELGNLQPAHLREILVKLARFRNENKEWLSYLLFEAQDEPSYVLAVREEMDMLFETVPRANIYFVKKSVRKILRFVNRSIRYSGVAQTELEIRIHFCRRLKESGAPLDTGTVLYNLYQQQLKKINTVFGKLVEDIQLDYTRDLEAIRLDVTDGLPR